MDKLFVANYALVISDDGFSKKDRAVQLIKIIAIMSSSSLVMILFGLLNIRNVTLLIASVVTLPPLLSQLFVVKYYVKSGRDLRLIEEVDKLTYKRKKMAFIGLLSFFLSFSFMIGGGVLMSYLWGQYEQ